MRGSVQLLPSMTIDFNHPLYKAPDFVDLDSKFEKYRIRRHFVGQQPQWQFDFDKSQYTLGEIITGELSIDNLDRKESLELSPPFRGFLVSTFGVWASRLEADMKWEELVLLSAINRGAASPQVELQGEPIIVKANEKWHASLAINGSYSDFGNGDSPSWRGCVGFDRPGKYRVYLQYVNMEQLLPFQYRWPFRDQPPLRKERTGSGGSFFDFGPTVLGPYDLEIFAPNDALLNDSMKALFQNWKPNTGPRYFPNAGRTAQLAEILKLASLQTDELSPVKNSLALTQIHEELNDALRLGLSVEQNRLLYNLLARTSKTREVMPSGPLKDAYGLTECYLHKHLGDTERAIKLAEQIGTPDTRVFIHDCALRAKYPERK